MKRKLKKSYRLGISAGILSGIIIGIITYLLNLVYPVNSGPFSANFLSVMFISIISFIVFGLFFVAFINLLPTDKIFTKALVLNLIFCILSIPGYLLIKEVSWLYILIDTVSSIFIYSLVYAYFYLLLAKKFSGITKINKIAFGMVIVLIFLFFFGVMISEAVNNIRNKASTINLNSDLIEKQIFSEVNKIRLEYGREPLEWNSVLHKIANSYSKELSAQGYISHLGNNKKTFLDKYKEERLFFFVGGENLFQGGVTENFYQQPADYWMKSPAHRSLLVDADEFFTHGAVGVTCNNLYCIAVLNLAGFEYETETKLLSGEFFYYNLNDPSYGLKGDYPVGINLKSDKPVEVYIFDNIDQIELFFEYDGDYSRISKHDILELSLQTEAKKDSYLVVFSNNTQTADISLQLVYNQEVIQGK